jgi:predicted aspartyl protease
MKKHAFTRKTDESLILVKVQVNQSALYLALDTGATHTVIEMTALLLANCRLSNTQKNLDLETASGIVTSEIYETDRLECLGIQRKGFKVHSYDLIATGILTDIDGVLGLDFFEGYQFCIDLGKQVITVNRSK